MAYLTVLCDLKLCAVVNRPTRSRIGARPHTLVGTRVA